jgi:hypothetical protein
MAATRAGDIDKLLSLMAEAVRGIDTLLNTQ